MGTPTNEHGFADTSFFVAGLNKRDAYHEVAKRFSGEFTGSIVTSQWVLVEVANYFAASNNRIKACEFVDSILMDRNVECVLAEGSAFSNGWKLYRDRLDKAWSLTDCLSFQIMEQRHIRAALTADHHFEQAGFEILLK
jgi:uncharacterized protein